MSLFLKNAVKNKSGVTLVLTLGVMSVIILLVLSNAVNMRLEEKAAYNYEASVRAAMAAQAGIEYAVAVLKDSARSDIVSIPNIPFLDEPEGRWTCEISVRDINDRIAN